MQMKNLNLLKIVKNFAPICVGVMCVLWRITRHQIVLNLPLCLPLLQVKGMGLDLNQTEKTVKGEG